MLAHAFQFRRKLQASVIVRADREKSDDRRRIVVDQIAQQSKERLRFFLCLGEKQLLPLVDRDDQGWRLRLSPAIRSHRRRLVGERLQQRLELYGAGLDDRAQVGARHRNLRRRKSAF